MACHSYGGCTSGCENVSTVEGGYDDGHTTVEAKDQSMKRYNKISFQRMFFLQQFTREKRICGGL
jgi:hypothetical protein